MEQVLVLGGDISRLILPFIVVVFGLATVIIGLDCVWRMEKRLRSFMRILTLAAATFLVKKIMLIMGFDSSSAWYNIAQSLDIATAVFLFFAFVEMYKIVRFLDNEK